MDSTARIVSSMQSAAQDLDLRALQDHEAREIIGLGLKEAIERLYPGLDDHLLEPMKERYSYYYLEGDNTPTSLFPGAKKSLERLRDQGYRLAVATSKSRRGLDRVLAETGMGSLFEVTACADETASKPDPMMLRDILAKTGVKAERAVMVGDTEFDLEMAVNAHMDCIAVSYGAHHIDRLRKYNPVLEVHNFHELEDWLNHHTGERA